MSFDAVFLGGGCSRSGRYRQRDWPPTDSKKQCCARASTRRGQAQGTHIANYRIVSWAGDRLPRRNFRFGRTPRVRQRPLTSPLAPFMVAIRDGSFTSICDVKRWRAIRLSPADTVSTGARMWYLNIPRCCGEAEPKIHA